MSDASAGHAAAHPDHAEHMDHDMDPGHMAAEEAEIARLESVPDPEPVPEGDELSDASFAVGGMTCASCVAVIEKTLAKTPGVTSSAVNLATERLATTFDPAIITDDKIAEIVEKLGYTAMPLEAAAPTAQAGKVTLVDHRHALRKLLGPDREGAEQAPRRDERLGQPGDRDRHRRVRPCRRGHRRDHQRREERRLRCHGEGGGGRRRHERCRLSA